MKKLKIKFTDFWPDFDESNNLFLDLLGEYSKIEFSDNPDILIYSCYGFDFLKYKCPKIFYTAENVRPNFRECDFAFTFDYSNYGNRNFRLPLYRWRGDLYKLLDQKSPDKLLSEKTKFCCMLVSNPNCKERNLFFNKLSKYKKIDSGGTYLNNIGYQVNEISSFYSQYKFSLSFENSSYPGYCTEKIVNSMLVNCVPVYWGNNLVGNDFNSRSFINIHDFDSFDDAIERIIEIDNNEDLYIDYLSQPYFKNNIFPAELEFSHIKNILFDVLERLTNTPSCTLGFNRWYAFGNMVKKRLTSKFTGRPYWYC